MYVAIENKIDNFVGISCQIQIEFAGGAMSSPCGWVLCRETRSRTTCGVKLDGFFRCGSVPPCETYLFFYRSASPGGCSCGALPNAPREQRPDEERVRSYTRLDLGFAAFFFTRAQQPMWPFWRQKIGSCNQKTGPVENVGLGQTLRTGLDNGPPEKSRAWRARQPKKNSKTAGWYLGYITAGCNLAGPYKKTWLAPRSPFLCGSTTVPLKVPSKSFTLLMTTTRNIKLWKYNLAKKQWTKPCRQ
jgi:hypothetical protein